jgi:ABC-type transporter Mla subunit MlaD
VPAEKIDISYSLHDVLSAAAREAAGRSTPDPSATVDPNLAALLQQLNDLSKQIQDVMNQINQIDPTILGGKAQ